jgi:hypothetical protein
MKTITSAMTIRRHQKLAFRPAMVVQKADSAAKGKGEGGSQEH